MASNRKQVSKGVRIPAPVKGWHVGADLADAPPGTAYALNNAFPMVDYVRARGGCLAYATGIPGAPAVSSLMVWTNGATWKMFAACAGSIYDVSNPGAVGSALVTGLNAGASFQSIQFDGLSATYLIAVNGVDPSQIWNGTAWTTSPAITGVTDPALSNIWAFKNRLYFIGAGTLHCWYLGLQSIGGAATLFDLSSIFTLGGYLVAGASWAVSSNSGLYETCVFITSMGEIAVYTGGWPGDSAWTLVGTYRVSLPLGPRCLMKAGGDLAIMTLDGIVAMSQAQNLDQIALQNVAVTASIGPAWLSAVQARTGLSGWQIVSWPAQSMGIVCLPKMNANDRTQFVANMRTGAWCQYLGWDANCFAVMNNQLFFGTSDGRVMEAETGGLDDGAPYTVTVFPSFSDGGAGLSRKDVKLVRPMVQANFILTQQVTINVDFNLTVPGPPMASSAVLPGAEWGAAIWGVATWASTLLNQAAWIGAYGMGADLSAIWKISISSTVTPDVRLSSIDVLAEVGSILG